jgi:hypothetical protein
MRLYLIWISLFIIGCSEKKPDLNAPKVRKPVIPPPVQSLIYNDNPLEIAKQDNLKMDVYFERYSDYGGGWIRTRPNSYNYSLIRCRYPNAEVFIYKYDYNDSDTLEIYRDSLRYNSVKLEYVGSRQFIINNYITQVNKYTYAGFNGTHAIFSELYIAKPSGLIMQHLMGHLTVSSVEYDGINKTIQEQILQDSVFYTFESLKSHLKKN